MEDTATTWYLLCIETDTVPKNSFILCLLLGVSTLACKTNEEEFDAQSPDAQSPDAQSPDAQSPDAQSVAQEWVVDPTQRHLIVDTSRYEAFPVARRFGDQVVMVWSSLTDHFGAGTMKLVTSSDGRSFGEAQTVPRPMMESPGHGVPGVAVLGDRIAFLHMTTSPYAGWVTVTNDLAVWPAPSAVVWDRTSWTFPSDLAWVDDGTTQGRMLATSYGGDGVLVSQSKDAGKTWTPLANPLPGTSAEWPYSEATITHLGGGKLLMMVRWEENGAAEIRSLLSMDYGVTWSAPVTALTEASGMPQVAAMPDGALLMTVRDKQPDDSPESWSFATSLDRGNAWTKHEINDLWMMYGTFVVTPLGDVVLIGASQDRTSSTNADVWSMPVAPIADKAGD